jgi:RimJ/RimL family protein N-acetyltransferase
MTAPMIPLSDSLARDLAARVPVLRTERLHLRAPVLADWPAYRDVMMSDRARHMGGPFTDEDAFADFCQGVAGWLLLGGGMWTMTPHDGDTVLGWIFLWHERGDPDREIGWIMVPGAEGQGFATEGAMAARDHAFGTLGLTRLVSYIDPENPRSIAVARRLGARLEGLHDDAQVWVHAPVAPAGVSPRVETEGRRMQDARDRA